MSKRKELQLRAVQRGKYAKLYQHFVDRKNIEWSLTFAEIENILGFKLPNSAYIHRPWWANATHSHSMAWTLAGWKSSGVDLERESVTFRHEDTEYAGGKYWKLNKHLSDLKIAEWNTTFSELEDILGFSLPDSAYLYRPWWANAAHSQSLGWTMAGWETSDVNMDAETLMFRRKFARRMEGNMINPTYRLTLGQTYYNKGFINLGVDIERYISKDDGPMTLLLGAKKLKIDGRMSRKPNMNGTPRIFGGVSLQKWFWQNFDLNDEIDVVVISPSELWLNTVATLGS